MSAQKRNPWAALSALCIGFFMILLDLTIVNVAIPPMADHLHASLNSIVWVISVYMLTYAVPMLFTSRLGDRFGPKRVFLLGLLIFTASSLWCGLSTSVDMLITARAVQGLGAALMTPQTLAFITYLFPPEKRGAPMGMWGGIAGLATITGPLLGGALTDSFGWQWIFYVNVPIGVIAMIAVLIIVPDWQPKHAHSFDFLGILLSGAGLFCLVFGIQNGQQYNWGKITGFISIPLMIAVGVALLLCFIVWQFYNKKEPLVPMRLFRLRNFSAGNVAIMTVGFTLTGLFLPLTIYLQSVLGYSPFKAGLVTAPMSLISGIAAPFVGRFIGKIAPKFLAAFGLIMLGVGIGGLIWLAKPEMNPWRLTPALLACGLGVGFVFSPLSNVTINAVERRLTGAASGVFNTTRQVGSVLGSAAIGVLLQARVSTSMHSAAVTNAQQLAPQYRQQFVDGLSSASASSGEFAAASAGPKLPPGIPTAAAAHIKQLATDAFHTGFTDAARVTLLLPIAVIVLGVIACAVMRRRAVPAGTAEPTSAAPADGAGSAAAAPARSLVPANGEISSTGNGIVDNGQVSRPTSEHTNDGVVVGVVRSSTGAAIAGARVTMTDESGHVLSSQLADDDGAFHLAGLPTGTHTLIASDRRHRPAALPATVNGVMSTPHEFALTPAGAVSGVARDGQHGRAVADALITVLDSTGHVVATTSTADDGTYSVAGLPDGQLTVIASGYPPAASRVRLEPGEQGRLDVRLSHDDQPAPTPTRA